MVMQKLRSRYFMKTFLWIVLGITIPSFVLFYGFGTGAEQAQIDTGPLVTVELEGKAIELDHYDLGAAKDELTQYYSQVFATSFGQPANSRIQRLIESSLSNKDVADFAVLQAALREQLRENDIRVTNEQVKNYLKQSGMTKAQLTQLLQSNRISEAQYASIIRSGLLQDRSRYTIQKMARTSLLELWMEYLIANEKLTVEYMKIPVNEFSEDIEITDREARSEYDKLAAENDPIIIRPAQRVYEYIMISPPPMSAPESTEEELRAAYEEAEIQDDEIYEPGSFTVRQIMKAYGPQSTEEEKAMARTHLEQALDRIEVGDDFATVADEVTDDIRNIVFSDDLSTTTTRGGLLTIAGDETEIWGEDYIQFIKSAEPSDTSEILATPQGYVVVRLENIFEADKKSFEEVEPVLAGRVREQKQAKLSEERRQLIEDNFAKLREAVATNTTLDGIASAMKSEVKLSSPTETNATFIRGVGNLAREEQALTRLKPGEISPVLRTGTDAAVVLRIKEVIPEGIREFEGMKSRIRSTLERNTAINRAIARAEELVPRVEAGDRLTSISQELGYQGDRMSEPFPRSEPPQEFQTIQTIGSALVRAREGDVLIQESGFGEYINDIYMIHIENVDSPERSDFLKDMRNLENQMLQAKRQGFLEDFRQDAQQILSATYNEDFIGRDQRRRR